MKFKKEIMMSKKYVYTFGKGKADGNTTMKELLGGKGANLGELRAADLPVPPGYCLSAHAYRDFIHAAGLDTGIQDVLSGAGCGGHLERPQEGLIQRNRGGRVPCAYRGYE